MFVCEPNYLVGEVLTCVCPNPRLVLTAGTSSVVCVWVYHKKQKQLQLQHSVINRRCFHNHGEGPYYARGALRNYSKHLPCPL